MAEKKTVDWDGVLKNAVERGIDAIIENHPKFRGAEDYITRHINKSRLNKGLKRIRDYVSENGSDWDEERKVNFIYDSLANYVASGRAFDESAKQVILKNSLEERVGKRGLFSKMFSRKNHSELEGEEEFEKVTDSFREIYDLMKTGDYAAHMPDLANAATEVYKMGFLDSTVDILKSRGLMDDEKYTVLKQSIRERTREESYNMGSAIKRHMYGKKITASIIGLFGLGLLILSGRGLTANVINMDGGNTTGGFIGLILFVTSLFLLFEKR